MAKNTLSFVCQNCGAAYNRWQGKCESCGEWNTLVEEDTTGVTTMPASIRPKRKGRAFALESLTGESRDAPRLPSGLTELDRVTGGGFVRGSVLLVGGDPGIGKSTLLTQASSLMARAGHRSVYISGEEAVAQVRLRAARLELADAPVQLASETSVEDIIATLSEGATPRLVVIDANIAPVTLEAKILQDADRLDAIGMVGVARCFYVAGRLGRALYDPVDPQARHRPYDDTLYGIDHFHTKLLGLASDFQTATGARLAEQRSQRLSRFLDEFLDEL